MRRMRWLNTVIMNARGAAKPIKLSRKLSGRWMATCVLRLETFRLHLRTPRGTGGGGGRGGWRPRIFLGDARRAL